jgi:hypothetical protein
VTTLRCTQKILGRMKSASAPIEQRPDNALGDWYANPLNFGRLRFELCVAERTLLPAILPARHIRLLPDRLPTFVEASLTMIGVSRMIAAAEAERMRPMTIGPTRSRVVLGVMNEMAFAAQLFFDRHYPEYGLKHASLHLAEGIYSPIGYSTPAETTIRLLAGGGS